MTVGISALGTLPPGVRNSSVDGTPLLPICYLGVDFADVDTRRARKSCIFGSIFWSHPPDSNRRPADYESLIREIRNCLTSKATVQIFADSYCCLHGAYMAI